MRDLAVASDVGDIVQKVERGERLMLDDGIRLYESPSLLAVGWAANLLRRRLNGERTYYVVNCHINYTNVCKNQCRFCAFRRYEGQAGAYTLTVEDILQKASEARCNAAFTELHIVGGLNPSLPLEYYLEMLSAVKARMPGVHIQALTAVEVQYISEISGLSVAEVLSQLRQAGLGSLPGGGAEVFSGRVRREVCPAKLPADGWLDVMRTAHGLGIQSNATMLYGHIETVEERVEHLIRLRSLQDETGGFMAFIPLAYHPDNTQLGSADGKKRTSGIEDLKTIAVSRLVLDNFNHVKAFWIMLGVKLAQVSLSFGADDFDGTVVEEKITHSAGAKTPEAMSVGEIVRLIRETGTTPVERDTVYAEVVR